MARSMHFLQRTYGALFAEARARLPVESANQINLLEGWLAEHAVDQKQADAMSLLSALATLPKPLTVRSSPAPFRLTEAWAEDLAAAGAVLEVKHDPDPSVSM
jgi:hypothetical protein